MSKISDEDRDNVETPNAEAAPFGPPFPSDALRLTRGPDRDRHPQPGRSPLTNTSQQPHTASTPMLSFRHLRPLFVVPAKAGTHLERLRLDCNPRFIQAPQSTTVGHNFHPPFRCPALDPGPRPRSPSAAGPSSPDEHVAATPHSINAQALVPTFALLVRRSREGGNPFRTPTPRLPTLDSSRRLNPQPSATTSTPLPMPRA